MFKETERTTYLVVDNQHPCAECDKLTNQIDVFFQVRMCSDECVKIWDDNMNAQLKDLAESESHMQNDEWEGDF